MNIKDLKFGKFRLTNDFDLYPTYFEDNEICPDGDYTREYVVHNVGTFQHRRFGNGGDLFEFKRDIVGASGFSIQGYGNSFEDAREKCLKCLKELYSTVQLANLLEGVE